MHLSRLTKEFTLTFNQIKDSKEFNLPPLTLLSTKKIQNIINNERKALRLEEHSNNGPSDRVDCVKNVGKKRAPAKNKVTED